MDDPRDGVSIAGVRLTASWFRQFARRLPLLCIGIILLAEVLCHVFVWTYVADDSRRGWLTQWAVMAVGWGALSAALIFIIDRSDAFRLKMESGVQVSIAALYFVAMTTFLWLGASVLEGWLLPLAEIKTFAVWGGVLTLSLASVCWLLGATTPDKNSRMVAAILFGVAATYALLGGNGTPWLLWFLIPAAIIPVVLRKLKRIDFSDEKLVANWVGFVFCAFVWQTLFGKLALGWDFAVAIVATITCAFALRLIGGQNSGLHAQPAAFPATERQTSLIEVPKGLGILDRWRWIGVGEMLTIGWLAMGFNLICWTEPELQEAPPRPGILSAYLSEPALGEIPPISSFQDTTSRYSQYVAEMDRYNDFRMKKTNAAIVHGEVREIINEWNEMVRSEVHARRWAKGIGLVILPILTVFYLRRLNTSARVAIHGKAEEGLACFREILRVGPGRIASTDSHEIQVERLKEPETTGSV